MTHRNTVEWLDINAAETENYSVTQRKRLHEISGDDSIENILGVVKLRDYIDLKN